MKKFSKQFECPANWRTTGLVPFDQIKTEIHIGLDIAKGTKLDIRIAETKH